MYLRGGEKGLIFVSNIYLRKINNISPKVMKNVNQ